MTVEYEGEELVVTSDNSSAAIFHQLDYRPKRGFQPVCGHIGGVGGGHATVRPKPLVVDTPYRLCKLCQRRDRFDDDPTHIQNFDWLPSIWSVEFDEPSEVDLAYLGGV